MLVKVLPVRSADYSGGLCPDLLVGRCGVELEPLANALKQVVATAVNAVKAVTIMRWVMMRKTEEVYATTQYNPVQAVILTFR